MASAKWIVVSAGSLVLAAGFMGIRAQDPVTADQAEVQVASDLPEKPVADANCTFFGPQREKLLRSLRPYELSGITEQVTMQLPAASDVMRAAAITLALPSAPGGSRTNTLQRPSNNLIDKYIFPAMDAAGVKPAPPTTDFEFVRRIYLDLTGRIPTATEAMAFVQDSDPQKRSKLIDTLVGSAGWVDKWTMWYADQLENNSRNTQIVRYLPSVLAFNDFLRSSLQSGKPYDQMVREMIAAQGNDSFTQGELNFIVGGVMGGGPVQDVFDMQLVKTMDAFMGISHMDCLLCHTGRGHLDQISLWGYQTSRQQAWGMASFMSHTFANRNAVAGAVNGQPYYWSLQNDVTIPRGFNYALDYQLNTQTGNRPARGATNSTARVKPVYIFDNTSPAPGTDYRTFLARKITSDFQFARATVNYMWEAFFGMGLVNPSNQFDPARQDPDNPPKDCPPDVPCTLQASNPRLLNALAQDFINSGYDVRALQKEIVNSRAYQLSSRYEGTWNPQWQPLFARKMVRRLWAEELHDAVALSSNVWPSYPGTVTVAGSPVEAWGPVNWAMKFPEPISAPGGGGTNTPASAVFLDAFLRGNRDDQDRRGDGSISQALTLMNDNFILSRVRASTPGATIVAALAMTDNRQLVNTLYVNILSRFPTDAEMTTALGYLNTTNATTRRTEAQNLMWSLYNSVSFVFNY